MFLSLMGPSWVLPMWLLAMGMEAQPLIGLFWKQHSPYRGISLQPLYTRQTTTRGEGAHVARSLESDPVISRANLCWRPPLLSPSHPWNHRYQCSISKQVVDCGNGTPLSRQPGLQGLPSVAKPEASPFWKKRLSLKRK